MNFFKWILSDFAWLWTSCWRQKQVAQCFRWSSSAKYVNFVCYLCLLSHINCEKKWNLLSVTINSFTHSTKLEMTVMWRLWFGCFVDSVHFRNGCVISLRAISVKVLWGSEEQVWYFLNKGLKSLDKRSCCKVLRL